MHFVEHITSTDDDDRLRQVAYDLRDSKSPTNDFGIPVSTSEIMEEMREQLRSGLILQVEINGVGRFVSCRFIEPNRTVKEKKDNGSPWLGNMDSWKQGIAYNPDLEPHRDETDDYSGPSLAL